jgi:EF hand
MIVVGELWALVLPIKSFDGENTMTMRILAAIPVCLMTVAIAAAGSADMNGDGLISKEEFRNEVARVAFEADKNKNGKIDEGEYKLSADERKAMDSNNDGKVTVEEFQAAQMKAFAALDKNNDGSLDADEAKG